MGLKDLFSAEARKQKAFDKMLAKLVSRNQQHEDRMWCIEQLSTAETPEATAALFRRWDMTADKSREDVAEKEYLADVLVAKGEAVLPFLSDHNDRSINITWPIQVLRRIVGPAQVVDELLRVLAREQARLAAFRPEKKLRLLQLLADHADDPRIGEAVLPSLDDFDADVRFETVELLRKLGGEGARDVLLSRLTHPEEDSARVRQAILSAVRERGWKVVDRRDDLLPHLGEAYRIGPKGTLIVAD